MAKGGVGKGCKVCCIIILVVFLLIVGASAFVALYVPKADKLADKLASSDITVLLYEEGRTDYSTSVNSLISFINENFETEYTIQEVVEFRSTALEKGDEEYVEGYVFYLSSIKSAFGLFKDYAKYISEKSSEEAESLEYHFSPRGKALFIGNMAGEVAFRKIVF